MVMRTKVHIYIHFACTILCRYAACTILCRYAKNEFLKIKKYCFKTLQAGLGENIYDEDGCFNVQDYYTVYMKITHKQVSELYCWSTNIQNLWGVRVEIILIGVLLETHMDVSLETLRLSLEIAIFSLETPRLSLETRIFLLETRIISFENPIFLF